MKRETLESTLALLRRTSPTPLDRVVEIVRSYLRCSAAALVASNEHEGSIISSAGFQLSLAAVSFPMRPEYQESMHRPFESDLKAAVTRPGFCSHPWLRKDMPWTYVASIPVPLRAEGWTLNLLCLDARDRTGENLPEQMTTAAKIIADEISLISEIATLPPRDESLSTDLRHIGQALRDLPCAAILLDQDLIVVDVNRGLSENLFFNREDQIGRPLAAIMQKFGVHEDALEFARAQLERDDADVSYSGQIFSGAEFRLTALKFNGDNPYKKYLLILLDADNRAERHVLQDSVKDRRNELDIAGRFLLETLIPKRRLINRGELGYHALARWRTAIKTYQLAALKLIKEYKPIEFLDRLADHLALASAALFGEGTFQYVGNVPCGHSGPDCFARQLARQIAAKLGLPHLDLFADLEVSGTSHPRKNVARPKMKLEHVPSGPVLLIDDVATSGSHICEATRLLRERNCGVFPLAWIGP